MLSFYDERFKNAIKQYELTEDHLYYTGHPKDCIELAKKDADRYSVI